MQRQRLTAALTAVNAVVLLLVLVYAGSVAAQDDAAVVHARTLELVDEQGQVRSWLGVEPNGEVVLRMTDQTGTIRVKLGAGADGSGLLLLDDETEPGVHLVAKPTGPTVTLTDKDGQALILTP